MTNHLEILKKGVKFWNGWRKDNLSISPYLHSADLSGTDLCYANLSGANLSWAKLTRANLSDANLSDAKLLNANLSEANLSEANLYKAALGGANLSEAKLFRASLSWANLSGANLSRANLLKAFLFHADLSEANLSEANLSGATLTSARFHKANLSDANLFRAFLSDANLSRANLFHADLSEANLSEANLYRAALSGANLSDANLSEANLSEANLSGANLSEANLFEANLSRAILYDVNLSEANIRSSILIHTYLKESNFTKCSLGNTIFSFVDLSNCKNLETVIVSKPCSVDFDTLKNSTNIPFLFLSKIGLPDTYIKYLPDLLDDGGIKLFSIFLSHSSYDKIFTAPLYDQLINKGVNVWYDEKKEEDGDIIREIIHKGISLYDKVILVCSEASLSSWWVEQEIEKIEEKERAYWKQHGEKISLIIPISIDNEVYSSPNAIASNLRKRLILDFREPDEYDNVIEQLILALNPKRGINPKPLLNPID